MSFDPADTDQPTSNSPNELHGPLRTATVEPRRPSIARGRSRYFSTMLVLFIVLLALVVGQIVLPALVERLSYRSERGRARAAREELEELGPTKFAETSRNVAKAVGASVVFIDTRSTVAIRGRLAETAGQGSGVIVDETGYILTNSHVIEGAERIRATLDTGQTLPAEVVGVDTYTDLAVLKIEADGLLALPWGDSDALEPGDPVWAVGSPYGFANSVSFGIISAKGRSGISETKYQDYLQTDAAVNPGNSGGALVNSRGQLVGINTLIIGNAYRGISFAIPSKMARGVYDRSRTPGKSRGLLGVYPDKVSAEVARRMGLSDGKGALVDHLIQDSPADRGGVKEGDVIVAWNGQEVENPNRLMVLVSETAPETTVEMIVVRDGERTPLKIKVGRLPRSLQE
jgi:S1-C subfamily serine protease